MLCALLLVCSTRSARACLHPASYRTQDARWAGDQAGAAAGLEAYEAALDAYMPGKLHMD